MNKFIVSLAMVVGLLGGTDSFAQIVVPTYYNAHTTQTPANGGTNAASLERGNWFHTSAPGLIRFGKYWKAAGSWSDTVTIRLWDSSGTLIASCTTNAYGTESSAAGWQVCPLLAYVGEDTDFMISYSSTGTRDTKYTSGAITSADIVNGPISIPHDTSSRHNGVYGTAGTFPTTSSAGVDYFVEVSFIPGFAGFFE